LNVSVIIPAHNAADTLTVVLDAVLPELHEGDQIIVADDRSEDATGSVVRTRGEDVEYVRSHNSPGAAGTRNAGAAFAQNEWLLFLDSDAVPEKGWRCILDSMVRPDIHGIQGIYDSKAPGRNAATFYKNYYYHYTFTRRIRNSEIMGCATFFFAVRKDMFERTGGFDESFSGATVEDAEFASRLIGAGGRIILVPELLVHHLREYSFRELMGYEWKMMRAKMGLISRRGSGKAGSLTVSMARPSEMKAVLASSLFIWLLPTGLLLLLLGMEAGAWIALASAAAVLSLQLAFWLSMIAEGGWKGVKAVLISIPDLLMLVPVGMLALFGRWRGARS